MALHESQIGLNGLKPEHCALSGRKLGPEDIYFKVNGAKIGVSQRAWAALTPEQKAAMKAQWTADVPAVKEKTATLTPVYEDMELDALKALAKEKRVDIKGKNTVVEIAQALHVADVQAQFAPPVSVEAESGIPLDLSAKKGS